MSNSDYTDAELIERLVCYTHFPSNQKIQRWILIRDVLCVGSKTAIDLCKRYDKDPDEYIQGYYEGIEND